MELTQLAISSSYYFRFSADFFFPYMQNIGKLQFCLSHCENVNYRVEHDEAAMFDSVGRITDEMVLRTDNLEGGWGDLKF